MISRYGVRCGMRAWFLGMRLGVECAPGFSVCGQVYNACMISGYGVRSVWNALV